MQPAHLICFQSSFIYQMVLVGLGKGYKVSSMRCEAGFKGQSLLFSERIKLPQNHSHCPAAHSTYPNPGSNRLFAFDLIQPYFSFWHFLCPFPLPCAAGLGGCCLIHNPQINSLCICFSLLEYCLLVFTIKKKTVWKHFLKKQQ